MKQLSIEVKAMIASILNLLILIIFLQVEKYGVAYFMLLLATAVCSFFIGRYVAILWK